MAEMVYRLGGRHRALWEYQEGPTWHVHAQTELLEHLQRDIICGRVLDATSTFEARRQHMA